MYIILFILFISTAVMLLDCILILYVMFCIDLI